MNLEYISNSKKGINRDRNQDRILVTDTNEYIIFMVFDGVSSIPESYLFIAEFKKQFKLVKSKINVSGNNLDLLLYSCHEEALKRNIYGMCTFSLLFWSKKESLAKYINIGDSRIYIFSNQFIEKITEDDSLVGRENVITKCLGSRILSIKDFELSEVETSFNFLICTDGFYKLMERDLEDYFQTINFRYLKNIDKKIANLQFRANNDDSSYILIRK